jgi:glycyl-tRNA synthetase beta chain
MTEHRDLLIEVGTEELPPKSLRMLAAVFADQVEKGLSDAGVPRKPGMGELHIFAGPRRLGVLIGQLAAQATTAYTTNYGPALKVAFDAQGKPTPAATGFAQKCGVEVKDLKTLETDKGGRLYFEGEKPGRPTVELVPEIVQQALDKLPTPKRMHWGSGTAEFVRPVHWLVLLFGETVIEAELLGVRANRYTRGHRFHSPAPIHLDQPRDYVDALEKRGHVIPDFEKRRERVQEMVLATAAQEDAHAEITGMLLDEVTALTEWPQALAGSFDPSFLELPEEVIIAVLQDQQRCFPLRAADGRLLPRFIVIVNIVSRDPDAVRHGNERVIHPRLADAMFFWNQDRRTPLHTRLDGLKEVIFQKQLGTLYDKTQRVSKLAVRIAKHIGADAKLTKRAAELSRCDLLTHMVGEFPELQGIMGRYYAAHDGEGDEISTAIDEMYRPRFAGDALPKTSVGQALALADKLDTLAGFFGIGQVPTGDKDPFGLRRAALGVIRILVEHKMPLQIDQLTRSAYANFDGEINDADTDLRIFFFERFAGYLKDLGFTTLQVDAVLSINPVEFRLVPQQLEAVRNFQLLPEAESLTAANKRVVNILKQAEAKGESFKDADRGHLKEPAERALFDALSSTSQEALSLFKRGDYSGYLKSFAALKAPVDAFFDSVMVMVDDSKLRHNRLALLADLRLKMNRVADISRLAS